MAGGDYYSCDICGNKTFYDAELPYGEYGKKQLENPITHHPWPDGYIGWMVVICPKCAETHEVIVKKR